jgi:hypothetical protein
VVLLVALTWVMHDQAWGWAQPVNGTTAVAQVTKVGFALLGAFIGHHMALKGHLAELEALARRLASRADSTEDNEPDSTDLSADDTRSETGD